MTITMSGFTNGGNNVTKIIESVTALVITVTSGTGLVTESGTGDEHIVATGIKVYKTSLVSGEINSGSGFSANVQMIEDV